MTSSTTTRLEAMNRIARTVADKEIDSFVSVPTDKFALKVDAALRTACSEVANVQVWPWLNQNYSGLSMGTWTNERVTITDVQRVNWLKWGTGSDGYLLIPPIRYDEFFTYRIFSYTDEYSRPLYWTQNDSYLYLNPYPTTDDLRGKITMNIINTFVFPSSAGATFPMPERFLEAVIMKATYYICLNHVHDMEEASFYQGQYEVLMKLLQDTNRAIHPDNMYLRTW